MGKKRTRGGKRHTHSEEAQVRRRERRIEVEYERLTRTCDCPPWEPHAPDCKSRSVLEDVPLDEKIATCQRFQEEAHPLEPPPPATQTADLKRNAADSEWVPAPEKVRACSYAVVVSESSDCESEASPPRAPPPSKRAKARLPSPPHVVYDNKIPSTPARRERSKTPPPCCSVKRKPRHYDEPKRRKTAPVIRGSASTV